MESALNPRIQIKIRTVYIDGNSVGSIESAIESYPILRDDILKAWKAALLAPRGDE